jgi:hypothetical protein
MLALDATKRGEIPRQIPVGSEQQTCVQHGHHSRFRPLKPVSPEPYDQGAHKSGPSWEKWQLSQSFQFNVSEFAATNDRPGIGYRLVWGFDVAHWQRPAHRARSIYYRSISA